MNTGLENVIYAGSSILRDHINPPPIDERVRDLAKPFWIRSEGASIGVFMIHGFASNPMVFRPYGKRIADLGFSVCVPRLPGHGTTPGHMSTIKAEQWVKAVENEFIEFSKEYDKCIIIGHSLGALLAIILAAKSDPEGVILLSTPLRLKYDFLHRNSFLLKNMVGKLIPFWPVPLKKLGEIKDRGAIVYNTHSVSAGAEAIRLMRYSEKLLPKISAKLLLVIAKEDEVVHDDTHEIIKSRVKSKKVSEWIAPEGSHALIDTIDVDGLEGQIMSFMNKFK